MNGKPVFSDDAGLRKLAVSQRIRSRRIAAGLTQEQLAEKLGLKQYDVSRMESGEHQVDMAKLLKISQVLKWDVADILAGAGTTLLHNFNGLFLKLTPDDQRAVIHYMEALASKQKN